MSSKFKIHYESDLQRIHRDALEAFLAFSPEQKLYWFEFDEDASRKDRVYGDSNTQFKEVVELPGFYIINPIPEQLTAWGVDEEANAVVWLNTDFLEENSYKVTSRDEFEIAGKRYHVTEVYIPRGMGEIEYIITITLKEVS